MSDEQAASRTAHLRGCSATPEDHVRVAAWDALQNGYDYLQVIAWVDAVFADLAFGPREP